MSPPFPCRQACTSNVGIAFLTKRGGGGICTSKAPASWESSVAFGHDFVCSCPESNHPSQAPQGIEPPARLPLCSWFWGARGSSQSSRTGRAGIELHTLYTSRLKSSERVGGPAGATVCPRVSPSAAASQAAFAFLAPWLLINEEFFCLPAVWNLGE